ncbi:MAG: hypothetical protein K6C97_01705 [Treponema sp.]|nr:hypothetical protein [Treponema sp.]
MVKKTFSIILLLFLGLSAAWSHSLESKFKFTLEPTLSLSYENQGEYLLFDNKEPASYLEWNIFPIVRSGVKSAISFYNFTLSFEGLYAIPSSSGRMYDSDWNSSGVKVIYSENQTKLLSDFQASLKLSYDISLGRFNIHPALNLIYSQNSFLAHDGHGWYGISQYSQNGQEVAWNDENATYYPHIGGYSTYSLYQLFTFMGCDCYLSLNHRMKIGLGAYISPYTLIYSADYHYKSSGAISKYGFFLQNAWFNRFRVQTSFSFLIKKDLEFQLSASSILGFKTYGEYLFYDDPYTSGDFFITDSGPSASHIATASLTLGLKKYF